MCDGESDEIDIDHRILNHQFMEIGWCCGRSKIGPKHAAVAIKFNNVTSVVTGFGFVDTLMAKCSGSIKLCSGGLADKYKGTEHKTENAIGSQAFQGVFHTSVFNPKKYEYKGTFTILSIATEDEKARASLLVQSMQGVKMGYYKPMENNCRSFVIKVAELLRGEPEFVDENWNNFENEMQMLISIDYQMMKRAVQKAKSAFGAMLTESNFTEIVNLAKNPSSSVFEEQ